jgi:hypothetical protein
MIEPTRQNEKYHRIALLLHLLIWALVEEKKEKMKGGKLHTEGEN